MSKKRIVLASQSPRRKKLLEQIGLEFDILVTDVNEDLIKGMSPSKFAEELAKRKAIAAMQKIDDQNSIVIGADTIVIINEQILGKPQTTNEAFEMLSLLSNNTHSVITGVSIADTATNKIITKHKKTKVTFRKLYPEEIRRYITSGSPMDKAGAYGIQDDFGAVFVSNIEGCYYNVVGLPLEMLYSELLEMGGLI